MSDTPEPIEARVIVEKLALNELVGRAIADAFHAGFQAGYDAAITDSYGVEPDDAELAHERTIEADFARAQFLAADRPPSIGQDTARTAQYVTIDETTQRVRPMTDDEIAVLSAKVLPAGERLALDMNDEIGDDTRSESTIDSRQ